MRPLSLLAIALPIAALIACVPDDVDTGGADTSIDEADPGSDDTGAAGGGDLVGDWISTGDDLSPLFIAYDVIEVTASFGADGGYEVASVDGSGTTAEYSGTWLSDTSTDPAGIVLTQTMPYEAIAEGIFRVAGDVLTYEVVQLEPSYGFTAPTPASGFGSTTGPGLEAGDNIQIYARR